MFNVYQFDDILLKVLVSVDAQSILKLIMLWEPKLELLHISIIKEQQNKYNKLNIVS